jgi:hypothetical protein
VSNRSSTSLAKLASWYLRRLMEARFILLLSVANGGFKDAVFCGFAARKL